MTALVRVVPRREAPRLGQPSRAADWFGMMGMIFGLPAGMFFVGVVLSSFFDAPHVMRVFRETKRDVAEATVKKYAYEAYPGWRKAHPDKECPDSFSELNAFMNNKDLRDPWGDNYRFFCGARGEAATGQRRLVVNSIAEDGTFGTDDDLWSSE